MRNRSSFIFRQLILLPVFVLTLLASGTLNAAVSFNVTPGTMDAASLAPVTLQISGVAAGSTVLISKYVDYNGNGSIGANETMIQSFLVTDNHAVVFGGVTNTAVPGDSNPASGSINVVLNAANNGLTPYFSGKFIYKLSSPGGAFTAITKTFTVNNTTNTAYGSITGHVSNNGTTISNAAIIVLTAPDGGGYTSVGGGFANSSGNFTVKVPPGRYAVGAFLSNYVANIDAATLVTVTAGQSVTDNLTLTKANQSISGKVYDTNSNAGLAGFALFCQSTNGYAALGFTSPSGTFSVPVNNGSWRISSNERELGMRGYLSTQHSARVNATGGGGSVNIAVLKADAMIFGRILDNSGNPVAGVDLYSSDDAGDYEAEALTDVNGYYYIGASSADSWSASIGSPQSPAVNYVYTTDYSRTNISSGGSLEEDFSAIAAPYTISGYVDDATNGAIAGVDVSASASINGITYQSAYFETGSSGHYSINVANNATWTVQPANYSGDNGGLDGLGYNSVDGENVVIQNQNGQANFLVPPLGLQELDGYVMDSNGNPVVGVNVDANSPGYTNLIAVTDNNGYYEFYMGNGSWNVNVDCTDLSSKGYTNCPAEQDNIPVGGFGGNASGIDFVVQVPALSQYAPFFGGQVSLGSGWYFLQAAGSNPFGIYNLNSYPYVFHEDMGFEYFMDAGNSSHGAYFYDFTDGTFFYTDPTLFPNLYVFTANSWVYYDPVQNSTYQYTSGPRWFYNYTSGNWVTNMTYSSQ